MTIRHHQLLMGAGGALDPSYLFDTPSIGGLSDNNQQADFTGMASSAGQYVRSVSAIAGKEYCEFELLSKSSNNTYQAIGVSSATSSFFNGGVYVGFSRNPSGAGGCSLALDGTSLNGTQATSTSYSFAAGDRIGVAFDATTRKLWIAKNGSWITGDPGAGTGEITTAAAGTYKFYCGVYTCSAPASSSASFRIYPAAFSQTYAAPSGFVTHQP